MRGLVGKKLSGEGDEGNESKKGAGPSEVSVEMILASGEIGIGVMELCQDVLDGRGMPDDFGH